MNKNNILLIACLFFIALLVFGVYAQNAPAKDQAGGQTIVFHFIDQWSNNNFQNDLKVPTKIVNEDRRPTLLDILDGMARLRQVTIVLAPDNQSQHAWSVRVVEVNLTSYYTQNASNQTFTNNFVVIYDPTGHAYHNTTLATIGNSTNSTVYAFLAGEWREVIQVVMVYYEKVQIGGGVPVRNRGGLYSVLGEDVVYSIIALIDYMRTASYNLVYKKYLL